MPPKDYSPEMFNFEKLDFETVRPFTTPLTLLLMITNQCVTECVYCYADNKTKIATISYEKIVAILEEANKNNIAEIIVTGGEFFLYKKWDILLDEFKKYNYRVDMISAKIPLLEADIIKLKKHDSLLQISLDSFDPNILSKILNVNKNYLTLMKECLLLLDKHNIKFQVATVITKYNKDLSQLNDLHTFLSKLSNIARWEIRVAFKSLYRKVDFDQIKVTKFEIESIKNWIDKVSEKTKLNILWSPEKDSDYFKTENGSKYFAGGKCSANMSNLVILPDGKVTICEQLYWKERFIIGDISHQKLDEIWNSPKALKLLRPEQENVNPESACNTCKIYDECMFHANKCIADIIKAYGDEKFDYPDPRCSQAPKFINNMLHS